MGIFARGEKISAPPSTGRFKILIIAEDGETLYWHKRDQLHLVEQDVAEAFVRSFNTDLFQVAADGSLQPAADANTKRVLRVEMKRA